jgi:protein TonB
VTRRAGWHGPGLKWGGPLSLVAHTAALGLVVWVVTPSVPQEPSASLGLEVVWATAPSNAVGEGAAAEPAMPSPAEAPPAPEEPPAAMPEAATTPPTPSEPEASPPPPADTPAERPPEPTPAPAPEPNRGPLPADPLPMPPPAQPRSTPPRASAAPPAPATSAVPPSAAAAEGAPGPGRVTAGRTTPPRPDDGFRNASPTYPETARQRGQEGSVLLDLTVGVDGRVLGAEVAQSSGFPILDAAARRAALGWRFRPALDDGQPVPARLRSTVQFRLQ